MLGERILPLTQRRLSGEPSCQLALVRLVDQRVRCHSHLLLWSGIIEIVTGKNVIIINCMVQLLLLVSLLVLLVSIMVHVIHLTTCSHRCVGLHIRGACRHKRSERLQLRRAALHRVKAITGRVLLHLLVLWQSLWSAGHIEILVHMLLRLLIGLGHHRLVSGTRRSHWDFKLLVILLNITRMLVDYLLRLSLNWLLMEQCCIG